MTNTVLRQLRRKNVEFIVKLCSSVGWVEALGETQHIVQETMIAELTNDHHGWWECRQCYGIIAAPAYKPKMVIFRSHAPAWKCR